MVSMVRLTRASSVRQRATGACGSLTGTQRSSERRLSEAQQSLSSERRRRALNTRRLWVRPPLRLVLLAYWLRAKRQPNLYLRWVVSEKRIPLRSGINLRLSFGSAC